MRHKRGDKINGWLVVDKPEGMGSTQVVNLTRRLFNAQKNGHGGTLDPFATGVLPIAFGEATKMIDFITDGDKEYEFTLCFGSETDSADCTGNIIASGGKIPNKKDICAVIPDFCGILHQTPPAFSAIKINGQRAYDLARRGEKVEIPEREVTIYDLQLLNVYEDCADFKVKCSKGTYVRSLGRDIARKLGSFGHLRRLRRTRCGIFTLDDTILLENLQNMMYISHALLPLETSLRDIAVMAVSEVEAAKLRQGQALSPQGRVGKIPLGSWAAAMCDGCLIALVRMEERRISPVRVFNLT